MTKPRYLDVTPPRPPLSPLQKLILGGGLLAVGVWLLGAFAR